MPSSLFDYVPGSFHTVGLTPRGVVLCNDGTYDIASGFVPACLTKGGQRGTGDDSCRFGGTVEKCSGYWLQNRCTVRQTGNVTTVSCPPKATPPPPPPPPGVISYCNPASDGKRFSFNFPSGKKWTLSQKDDASARVFYCSRGTGPLPMPEIPDENIMDVAYCTGGEGLYDGQETYWVSTARQGCKVNREGVSKPYGRSISRDEYINATTGGWKPPPEYVQKMIVYTVGIRQDGNGMQVYKIVARKSQLRSLPTGGYEMWLGDYGNLVAESPAEIIRLENQRRPADNQLPANLPVTDLTYGESVGPATPLPVPPGGLSLISNPVPLNNDLECVRKFGPGWKYCPEYNECLPGSCPVPMR